MHTCGWKAEFDATRATPVKFHSIDGDPQGRGGGRRRGQGQSPSPPLHKVEDTHLAENFQMIRIRLDRISL